MRRTEAAPAVLPPENLEQTRAKRRTRKMLTDPKAFRPMKVTASRETEVGFEVEPITKKVTLDKMRIHSGNWPRAKGWHTDYDAAHRLGQRTPIILGNQAMAYIAELLVKFFGEGYLGGTLSTKIIRIMEPDDEITARGVVRKKVTEGDAIRLILNVWCENQRGQTVIVGTASGLVR